MEVNEEKRAKFMENAGKRVNKVMHDIQILEPMARSSVYDFTKEDVEEMFTAMQDALDSAKEEFNKKYQEFQQAIAKDSLPPNIAERRQKELQDMMQRQEQFQQDAQQQMAKAQNDAMAPIYQKLDNAIKAVGAAEGVIYIFDLARTSIPYVNESQSINLTSKVKANLGIK